MKELTIIEALCILNSGFSNPDEKELYDKAYNIVYKEGKRLKMIQKKEVIELELKKLNDN